MGRNARVQQIHSGICSQRPVVVLTGTIHTGKRLLVEQAFHSVLGSDALQCLHNDLIVVNLHIDFRIDRCQLMLCRSCLVMLCLGRNTQFPQFLIYVLHVCRYFLPDGSQIMVIHLLALRRHSAEKRASRKGQVLSLHKILITHQKIFLLRSHGGGNFLGRCITEKADQAQCLFINSLHRTQQRGFLIKGFPCIGTERCRNTECGTCRIMPYKRRRSTVPNRISSGLKGGAQSAGRKGRRVRFPFDQLFA